jgi:hypothetical protein
VYNSLIQTTHCKLWNKIHFASYTRENKCLKAFEITGIRKQSPDLGTNSSHFILAAEQEQSGRLYFEGHFVKYFERPYLEYT